MARKRKAQREHALERMRERFSPEAEPNDILDLEARIRSGEAVVVGIRAFEDTKTYRLKWRGSAIIVVYSPRYGCARTVFPPAEILPEPLASRGGHPTMAGPLAPHLTRDH
jgi:hypothetical protein